MGRKNTRKGFDNEGKKGVQMKGTRKDREKMRMEEGRGQMNQ